MTVDRRNMNWVQSFKNHNTRRFVPGFCSEVRNAKPKEKPYKLRDAKRLFLHIAPGGRKTWRYRYELPSGKD